MIPVRMFQSQLTRTVEQKEAVKIFSNRKHCGLMLIGVAAASIVTFNISSSSLQPSNCHRWDPIWIRYARTFPSVIFEVSAKYSMTQAIPKVASEPMAVPSRIDSLTFFFTVVRVNAVESCRERTVSGIA